MSQHDDQTRLFQLADGRQLAFCIRGDPAAPKAIWFDGTPALLRAAAAGCRYGGHVVLIVVGAVMVVGAAVGALRFETTVGLATAMSRLNPLITRHHNWRSHVRLITGVWLAGAEIIGMAFLAVALSEGI